MADPTEYTCRAGRFSWPITSTAESRAEQSQGRPAPAGAAVKPRRLIVPGEGNYPGARFRSFSSPATSFILFQKDAAANGLGLYISRGLLRSYGGELRLEQGTGGAHFVIELQTVQEGRLDDAACSEN